MTQVNTLLTEHDANDLAIDIVDRLVAKGLVPNCIDTDDNTEFEFQDAIKEALMRRFKLKV